MNGAPDFATAVLGYRRWAVRDGRLLAPYSLTQTSRSGRTHHFRPYAWEPGVNTAICNAETPASSHDSPSEHCECGLYGWERPQQWTDFVWAHDRDLGERLAVVTGAVALWGRLFVAESGVRAQYARILGLFSPADVDVAAAYGVPVLDPDTEFENVTTISEFFAALKAKDKRLQEAA